MWFLPMWTRQGHTKAKPQCAHGTTKAMSGGIADTTSSSYRGTGSVEWEWFPILKQRLIQMPVQFSRDPYVVEIPGRMGICMPYVVYPINASKMFVRELFHIPSDFVVDPWASDVESRSRLDCRFLHSVETTFGHLMGAKITSAISMA